MYTPRRNLSKNRVLPIPKLRQQSSDSDLKYESSGSENYKTTYDRSKSRKTSVMRQNEFRSSSLNEISLK